MKHFPLLDICCHVILLPLLHLFFPLLPQLDPCNTAAAILSIPWPTSFALLALATAFSKLPSLMAGLPPRSAPPPMSAAAFACLRHLTVVHFMRCCYCHCRLMPSHCHRLLMQDLHTYLCLKERRQLHPPTNTVYPPSANVAIFAAV
jgi:hypothetical protein